MTSLTAEAPDPKTFQSWEDAFKYPVPAVRRMEQQLRTDISGNRERLRTLVGTSYRELLGTAESIVHMDKQMRDAEDYLSNISQKCNTRLLEKTQSSTMKITKQSRIDKPKVYAQASHLVLLQQCPRVLISLMKSGKSLQLAAEVLVLSRLLHKKASQESTTSIFVDKLRTRLGKLRMKLLSIIDRRLAIPGQEANIVIDAMAAYALATNSSCADILRHFHHVRMNAISAILGNSESEKGEALKGLELWIQTMQDTQSFFPRLVSNALVKIKERPIVQDPALLEIQELDFDTHIQFVDDDIKHFTPYIRHDDLTVATAAQLLASWSPSGLKAYVERLDLGLSHIEDFQALLDLRKECLHTWVSSKGRTVGVTKSECLDILRKSFQARLMARINDQAKGIMAVVQAISESLQSSTFSKQAQSSLWTNDLVNVELLQGAKKLTEGIHARVHGNNVKNDQVLKIYRSWMNGMNSVRSSILDLRTKKWTIEELDDEEEDIEDIEDMRYKLEREDTLELDTVMQESLRSSVELLQNGINNLQPLLTQEDSPAEKSVFVLRVLREIKQTAPDGVEPRDMTFSFVKDLQRAIAAPVVRVVMQDHKAAMLASVEQIKIPTRLLWDGSPEAPIVPSPWPFKLLKSLQKGMSAIGFDIWTNHAVKELQSILIAALAETIQSSTTKETVEPVDKINGSNVSLDKKDAKIQLLFDLSYLSTALTTHGENEKATLGKYCDEISKEFKLSEEYSNRVINSAAEYWKRTSLLFNLLA